TVGEKHPDYAVTLRNLARLHIQAGKSDQAEPPVRQLAEVEHGTSGLNGPELTEKCQRDQAIREQILRCNCQANQLGEQGQFDKAISLARQAYELSREHLGEFHREVGASLNVLAGVYQHKNEFVTAEPLFRQALEVARIALGEEHPDYAAALLN